MDITTLSAIDLRARISAGSLEPVAVMEAFLDRIERLNPGLNAIVSLRPREALLAEARAADPRGGPLAGLPIAVKDLVATAGIRTTSGSPLFADFVPAQDELLAARLRAAGAILVGKTNTPEFGLGSHTFNPVFGPTRNPYDRTRTPGGSSGGAGAALAARLLPLADGSDAMGSLRNPAAFCNVYGFRPSWGLVPADPSGEMYLHTLATDGPMGRSPADCALLLGVLAGRDPRRPLGRDKGDLTLRPDASGRRIGWLGNWGGAHPTDAGILPLCEAALRVFKDLGAQVEPVAPPMPAEAIWEAWTTLRSWSIAMRQAETYSDPARRALLKPELLWEIERGMSMSAAQVHAASAIRSDHFRAMAGLFQRFDALVLPSAQVWPFPLEWVYPTEIAGRRMDTYHRWMDIMLPVSLGGLPALGLPAGFSGEGLPMGMQLFGAAGSDALILSLGQAYHEATDWPARRPPPDLS
jgi:amidase